METLRLLSTYTNVIDNEPETSDTTCMMRHGLFYSTQDRDFESPTLQL